MKRIPSVFTFIFRKIICPTACFFTLFVLALLISNGKIMGDKAIILFFASAGIALVNLCFCIPKISVYFKVATHFILLGLLLLAVLWLSDYMKTGNWVLLLVGYLIAYALIAPVALIIRARKKRRSAEQSSVEYDKRFS
ncbi:MAG: hypothetical protein IJU52_05425 [Clostridia bacterium]|nr:hypothetical protein [Clostridia bacterium]